MKHDATNKPEAVADDAARGAKKPAHERPEIDAATLAILRLEAEEHARRHDPEIEEDEGGGIRERRDRNARKRRGKGW